VLRGGSQEEEFARAELGGAKPEGDASQQRQEEVNEVGRLLEVSVNEELLGAAEPVLAETENVTGFQCVALFAEWNFLAHPLLAPFQEAPQIRHRRGGELEVHHKPSEDVTDRLE
jgi:hypothetical protein